MKALGKIAISVLLLLSSGCGEDGPATLSREASLLTLELEHNGVTYPTTVFDTRVTHSTPLPSGTNVVSVKTITLSEKATCHLDPGDQLQVHNSPISIEVTAEDGLTTKTYSLFLEVDRELSDRELLFENPTASNCEVFATLNIGDLRIENNAWNAGNLPVGSYSQCIYQYDQGNVLLFGWDWQYPNDAFGVNAFPQLIYGWKPWQPNSTTQELPKKIGDVTRLKVAYEVSVERDDGDYNLAFDNWINSSPNITPQNIQFEFMIWEEANNLVPFGDFQEDVMTTNGMYKFYMGEPTWEPPGSNWTYLAFNRVEGRQQGTVDIDELLNYLVSKGIVSAESYLATIELGNEVGNSTGNAIVKTFEVDLE